MPARRLGSRKPTRPRSSCASSPSLEGVIGAEYARLAGHSEAVCRAIEEQYLPDGADAPLPETEAGRVLSAADKIDTLIVSFSLGQPPDGLTRPVRAAAGGHRSLPPCRRRRRSPFRTTCFAADVREFVEERLEGYLDVPVEFVRAALRSEQPEIGAVAAQARFLAAQDLAAVHEVYSRAARIVGDAADAEPVDDSLLKEPAEQRLVEAVRAQPQPGTPADELLEWAVALAPVVAQFFDDVLVMDPDESVKANRLRLLRDVRAAVGRLGDLSQIPL